MYLQWWFTTKLWELHCRQLNAKLVHLLSVWGQTFGFGFNICISIEEHSDYINPNMVWIIIVDILNTAFGKNFLQNFAYLCYYSVALSTKYVGLQITDRMTHFSTRWMFDPLYGQPFCEIVWGRTNVESALWMLMSCYFSTRPSAGRMWTNPLSQILEFPIASLYPPKRSSGGGYTGFTLFVRRSVRPSVRPSVGRCPDDNSNSFQWI